MAVTISAADLAASLRLGDSAEELAQANAPARLRY